MGPLRAAVIGLAMIACGSTSQATADVQPSKSPVPAQVSPSPNPPWVEPYEAIDFINPSDGWAVTLSQADGAVEVVRTHDGGVTWGAPWKVAPLAVAGGDQIPHFGVKFENAQAGWVFGQGIYATSDGGQSWSDTLDGGSTSDVALFGGSAWAITGCNPNFSTCPSALFDWDASRRGWTRMPHQPPVTSGPFQLIRTSASKAFVVQEPEMDTRLIRTDDGGATWTRLAVPCRGFGMPVSTTDGVHLWMVCPGQPGAGSQTKEVYASADGGSHWTLRSSAEGTSAVGSVPIDGYAQWLVATSATTAFLALNRGDLYRSTDGGRTWVAAGISDGDGFFPAVQFVDARTGWAVAQGTTIGMDGRVALFRTVDAGASWTVAGSMPGTVG